MKRGLALISAACLILGFQNCSQSNLQSGGVLQQDVAVMEPSISGNDEVVSSKVTFVEIPNVVDASAGQAKAASASVGDHRLVISLKSGAINLMDGSNNVLQKNCLSSSSLDELKSILTGASICSAAAQSEDTMCAQVYTPGYVSLYSDDSRIALGEKRDSCGSGQKDLCGQLSSVFQNYISFVRDHWQEMECQ